MDNSETALQNDPKASPSAIDDREPFLPGFATEASDASIESDNTAPAPQPSAATTDSNANAAEKKRNFRGKPLVFATLLAILTGVTFAVSIRLIKPRIVVRETVREVLIETGIPLTLLPDSADASLWELLSNMYGPVDGVALQFKRGLASANGVTYRLQLDFCRSGDDVYARVIGRMPFVVRVNAQGRIVRIYPAPKGNRPLKELFAK